MFIFFDVIFIFSYFSLFTIFILFSYFSYFLKRYVERAHYFHIFSYCFHIFHIIFTFFICFEALRRARTLFHTVGTHFFHIFRHLGFMGPFHCINIINLNGSCTIASTHCSAQNRLWSALPSRSGKHLQRSACWSSLLVVRLPLERRSIPLRWSHCWSPMQWRQLELLRWFSAVTS